MAERGRVVSTMRGFIPPANIMGPQLKRLVLQALEQALAGVGEADARADALKSALEKAGMPELPDDIDRIAEFAFGPLRAAVERSFGAEAATDLLKILTPLIKRACDFENSVAQRASAASPAPTAASAAPSDGSKTVLVVDDEASARAELTQQLRGQGYGVVTASSGNVAIAVCLRRRPDLVVADAEMPGIGGAQLTVLLKAAFGADTPPVVLISADGMAPPDVQVACVLQRPATEDDLKRAVAAALAAS
ncbi:MAG: response regulator [Polyangiaceae bacterium]|nr:response regulator [Polyangiaceae bacterium]